MGNCGGLTPRLAHQQQKRLSRHRGQYVDRHSLIARALGGEPHSELWSEHNVESTSCGNKDSTGSSSSNHKVRGMKGSHVLSGGSVSFDTAFSSFLYALKEVQHTALRLKSQFSGMQLC